MKRTLVSLFCGSLLVAASPAMADGPRNPRAEALFQRGRALLQNGRVEAACSQFEASQVESSDLRTLLQLGDCYVRAGRSASAWHAFLEAQAIAVADRDSGREQIAAQRAAALEPKLTRVLLVIPTTSRVPGLTVQLGANTIPVSAWGTAIPVDAGAVKLSARAKGHRAWSASFDASAAAGKVYRVHVPTLTPLAEIAANRRTGFRTAGIVSGSIGLAGISAGAVFNALSRNADDASTCTRGVVQCAASKSTSNTYSDVATVSFAVGGTLFATGVTLFVLAPSVDRKEKHALRVAAKVVGNGGRRQLEGVW